MRKTAGAAYGRTDYCDYVTDHLECAIMKPIMWKPMMMMKKKQKMIMMSKERKKEMDDG